MFDTSPFGSILPLHATDTSTDESDVKTYLTWSHLTGTISGNDQQNMVQQKANIVNNSSIGILRLRGGMNPNIKKDLFDVPSLTKSRFMWNGLRSITFIEQIAYPLKNGLGQVTHKDASLLSCAEHKDPGGIMGNPPRAAASAKIISESQRRNEILFGAILNYMLPSCALYKKFMRSFHNNGIDVYWFIMAYGPLPKPDRVLKAQEDTWERMTMTGLKIEYSGEGYLLWIESVLEQGRILKKTGLQIKTKMVDGLPDFFKIQKSEMRHDQSIVFPATLGGLPEYVMTSLAGDPHPMAGQQDGEKLLLKYFADFVENASHVPKQIPRGLVRKVDDMMMMSMKMTMVLSTFQTQSNYLHLMLHLILPVIYVVVKDMLLLRYMMDRRLFVQRNNCKMQVCLLNLILVIWVTSIVRLLRSLQKGLLF